MSIKINISEESKKQVQEMNAFLGEMKKTIGEISAQKVDFKTFKEAEKGAKETKKSLTDLEKAQEKLTKARSGEGKELIKVRQETNLLNKENRNNAKLSSDLTTEYEKQRIRLRNLQKEAKDLALTKGQLSNEFQDVAKKARELEAELRDVDSAVGDSIGTTDRYNGIIEALVPGFGAVNERLDKFAEMQATIAGQEGGITSFFASLKGGIASATKASLAFIATPLGATIAGLTAIAGATAMFFKFNTEIAETNRLVEQLANTSGEATDRLREQATAINEAYGRDFAETVRELDALQKQFGISSEEAFDIYNDGLARGGAQNSEFGDSIREYSGLFEKNGFSAQEFIDILNTGIDLGLYSDKLPDAIKEAGLSLTEQTTATKDALINAFGETFSNDILSRINSGQITVKQALIEISEEANKAQLNQQQLAQLTADVFKGAGEDAGGALTIFEALRKSQGLQNEALTENAKILKETVELTNEFEKAKTEAFKSDSAVAFFKSFNNGWIKAKIALTDFTGAYLKLNASIFKFYGNFIRATKNVVKAIFNPIDTLKGAFTEIKVTIENIIDRFKQLEKFSLSNVKNAIFGAKKEAEELNNELDKTSRTRRGRTDRRTRTEPDTETTETDTETTRGVSSIQKTEEETKTLLEKVDALLKEKKAYEDNIATIEQYQSTASAEYQTEYNKELESYQEKLKEVNDELLKAGTQLPEYANAQELINKATKDNVSGFIELQEEIVKTYGDKPKKMLEELAEAEKNFREDSLQNAVDVIQGILDNEKLTIDERLKLEEDLQKAKEAIRKKDVENAKTSAQEILDAQKEKDEEEIQKAKETEKRKQEIKKEFTKLGFDITKEFANEFFSRAQERRELELAQFEQDNALKLEQDIALANEQGATQEELDALRARSEAKLAEKKNKIRQQEAVAKKRQALFDIAINTAIAVTAGLAKPAIPPFPSAIAAGVAGAIQLALVASRPLPKFAKGVRDFDGGMAVVGEQGAEIVETPFGSYLANREIATYLPKGTNVYTATETKQMLNDENILKELRATRQAISKIGTNVNVSVSNNSRINYIFGK